VRQPWVAWAGFGFSLLIVVVAAVLDLVGDGDPVSVGLFVLIGLPFAVVGALIAARLPDLPIGWLMLGTGLSLVAAKAADGVARSALSRSETPDIAGWAVLANSLLFNAFFLMLVATLFLLPNGSLPSHRWRIVRVPIGVLVVCDLLGIFAPGVFPDWADEAVRNPLGVGAIGDALGAASAIAVPLTFALLLTSIASVAVRFRGSKGVERAQLRWVAFAVMATGAFWVGLIVVNSALPDSQAAGVSWGVAFASVGIIPIGIGLAVLRYRLYEIDRVISRTLVYGSLTVVLGASYLGLVLAGQAVFSSFAGGSDLAVAVSTLVVAALFLPVRSRVQRFVDRRFYRRRYDAQRTLEGFGARLREQIDLGTLERDLRGVVAETMQPAHLTLWLRQEAPS
jgi:hypothetical protein